MHLNPCLERQSWLLWDSDLPPPSCRNSVLVLWNSYSVEKYDSISIPQLVEDNAAVLKSRFLEWIYDLGETKIKGRRLIDQLEVREGFSYWWMTILTGKSYGSSACFYDVIRLFALENHAKINEISQLRLKSSNQVLAAIIKRWCENLQIEFIQEKTESPKILISLLKKYLPNFPFPIKAVLSMFRFIQKRWILTRLNSKIVTKKYSIDSKNLREIITKVKLTFVDYLIHLQPEALESGPFLSNFWTELIPTLKAERLAAHWVHFFVPHKEVPTSQKAKKLINQFHQIGYPNEIHIAMETNICGPLIWVAFCNYIRLFWKSYHLRTIKNYFRPEQSQLDLWPLFKKDWFNSMRGPTAGFNCFNLVLFEKLMSQLPKQKLGIYLQENQAWEMAFIYAWRKNGHGRLIGIQHATVRDWDLRYFYAPRSYYDKKKNALPMPDYMAINSPFIKQKMQSQGYPEEHLIEVEALRYLYLLKHEDKRKNNKIMMTILIFGDYAADKTNKMMELLNTATRQLSTNISYLIKSHPFYIVSPDDYPEIPLQVVSDPLLTLFSKCDVVFVSNSSSVAMEAYCLGLPIIQMLDEKTFNLSPLRGFPNVTYVTRYEEFVLAINNIQLNHHLENKPYFFLDNALPRWKKLLALYG